MRKALMIGIPLVIALLGVLLWQFPFWKDVATPPTVEEVFDPGIDPATLTWKEVANIPWEARDSHALYSYKGALWMSGGLNAQESKLAPTNPDYTKAIYFDDIWKSADGMEWERVVEHAGFPAVRSASVFERKSNLYMIGGWSPDAGYGVGMWKSADGLDWTRFRTKPPFGNREGQRLVEFDGKIFMMGGVNYDQRKTFNDVWSTEDGETWKLVTDNAAWASRWDFDVAAFKGKLWLAGGMAQGGLSYADVWSSGDGVTWEKVTDAAPWGKRQGQILLVYKGRLWLVSGLDAVTNEGEGDTWYTEDGVAWEKAPQVGPWLGREDHAAIVFEDKMWVVGGMNSAWDWENDVWYSEFGTPQL